MSIQAHVKIVLYNILGEQLDVIADEVLQKGKNEIFYENSSLVTGMYIYSVETDSGFESNRLIVR